MRGCLQIKAEQSYDVKPNVNIEVLISLGKSKREWVFEDEKDSLMLKAQWHFMNGERKLNSYQYILEKWWDYSALEKYILLSCHNWIKVNCAIKIVVLFVWKGDFGIEHPIWVDKLLITWHYNKTQSNEGCQNFHCFLIALHRN